MKSKGLLLDWAAKSADPSKILSHNEEQGPILAHALGDAPSRKARRALSAVAVAGLLFGMVAAFGTVSPSDTLSEKRFLITEEPKLAPLLSTLEDDNAALMMEERIQRGDSLAGLLARAGIDDPEILEFLRNDKTAQIVYRQLSPGKAISLWRAPSGGMRRMLFPINGPGDLALDVRLIDGKPAAMVRPLKLETQVTLKSSEIRYSLFGATDSAGIPENVAIQLAEIFSGEIDFHRDLRKGDRFAVVYESVTHLGKEIRTGKVLAAEFINNGKAYRAAWFQSNTGNEGGYYSPEGKSLRKSFLRAPLPFSRVTSGFSSARFHPVLQTWRAHRGIDYGAVIGTPVQATGGGVVEFAGTQGGYGKVVVLRHQGRYTTLYGHLSGFAKGVRTGMRVSQGEVIGYVGATGLASGPHLHYEFRNNGVHQNPLATALPDAPPLSAAHLPQFIAQTQVHLTQIDRIRRQGSERLALVN